MKRVETDMALAMYKGKGMMEPPIPMSSSSDNLIIKELTAVNGDKVEITYSEANHRTAAYVLDISGDTKEVKHEDMPKELREIKDPMVFSAFLRDVYAKTVTCSNGDVRLDVCGRLHGGMLAPDKRDISVDDIKTLIAKGSKELNDSINRLLTENPDLSNDPTKVRLALDTKDPVKINEVVGSAKIKEATIVIGETGVGKSTLLNFLAGVPMVVGIKSTNKEIKAADPNKELIFKAYAGYGSGTTIPQPEVLDGKVYIDCPGFGDQRGPKQDIINAFCIKALFPRLDSVKILLTIPGSALSTVGRGKEITDLAHDLEKLLDGYRVGKIKCIAAVVTRADPSWTLKAVEADLAGLAKAAEDDGKTALNEFCTSLGSPGKIQMFKNPNAGVLPTDEREHILTMLNSVAALSASALNTGIAIDSESYAKLKAVVNDVVQGLERSIYNASMSIDDFIKNSRTEDLNQLKTKLSNMDHDNVKAVIAFINESLRQAGCDYESVERVVDFVKSIDSNITSDSEARIKSSIKKLLLDMSREVEAQIRMRETEADKQKAERAERESKMLESNKMWLTFLAPVITTCAPEIFKLSHEVIRGGFSYLTDRLHNPGPKQ